MGDLEVDIDGLEGLVSAMADVRHGLDDTKSVVASSADAMGSHDVVAALEHFESHWKDGRGRIEDNIDAISDAIGDSARAYRKADDDLRDSLQG